jgi:alkylmercury lyase
VPPSTLDTLAEALAGTFPGCEDAPLALALLRELANGEPVAVSRLPDRAELVLARWPNVRYDGAGRVVAFSGLSLTPTAHRFTVGGRQLYTWCAWDTLFLPAMLGQSAEVESTCPVSGIDVRLTVDPNGVRRFDPQPLWVSFPPSATVSTADITRTFCCHVHFVAAPERWLGQHPEGTILDLDQAYELGRKVTRWCTGSQASVLR